MYRTLHFVINQEKKPSNIVVMIIVLLLIILSMAALVGVWYYSQKTEPEPATPEKNSIAELYDRCLANPLSCEVGDFKTTIETEATPDFIDPEKEEQAAKLSLADLTMSIKNCKSRIKAERLRRRVFDGAGDLIAKEPIADLMWRNLQLDDAIPKLYEIEREIEMEKEILRASEISEVDRTKRLAKSGNKLYQDFLDMYGPKVGAGTAGGVTKCGFYPRLPPPIDIPEKDIEKKLLETGLVVDKDGTVNINITDQQVLTDVTDEEIEYLRQKQEETDEAEESWASRGNFYDTNEEDL